ncbi:MAG: hypothetical protein V9F00_02535 [Nocardioides sp.]
MIRYPLVALLALALASAGCGDGGSSNAPTAAAMFVRRCTPESPDEHGDRPASAPPAPPAEGPAEARALRPGLAVGPGSNRGDRAEHPRGRAPRAARRGLHGRRRRRTLRRAASARPSRPPSRAGAPPPPTPTRRPPPQETVEKTLAHRAACSAMATASCAGPSRPPRAATGPRRGSAGTAQWCSSNGLAPKYQTRADTQVAGVWGTGNNSLSDENLAQRMTALLTSGARLIDARAADNFADTAAQAEVYGNKYFFLSAVNYGNVYQSRVASMMDLEYPRAEGRRPLRRASRSPAAPAPLAGTPAR